MICHIFFKVLEGPSNSVKIYGIVNGEYDAQLCNALGD